MFTLYCLLLFSALFPNVFVVNIGDMVSVDLVKILSLLLIVTDIVRGFGNKKRGQQPKGKIAIRKNVWIGAMAAWCLWALLSLLWAKYKLGTLQVGVILCEGLIFSLYGARLIKTREHLIKVIDTLVAALSIHCFFCILELGAGIYLFDTYEHYSFRNYPVSAFFNTNNLAVYLTLMVFILIFAYCLTKKVLKRLLYVFLGVVSIFIITYTSSRGAIIACITGLAVFLALFLLRNKKILFVLVPSLIIGALFYTLSPTSNLSMPTLDSTLLIDTQATYGSDFYRINAYLNGIDFIVQTHGIGVSPGNVEYWMENYGARSTNDISPLHNWWLEIPVASGCIVTVLVLVAWLRYYKGLISKYFSKNIDKQHLALACATMAFGVAFCIASLSPSSLYKHEWPWLFLSIFFSIAYFIDTNTVMTHSPSEVVQKTVDQLNIEEQ